MRLFVGLGEASWSGRRNRIEMVGVAVLGLTPLLAGGCGSGTTPQTQATSFCGIMVPALRHNQRVVNQVVAYAQRTSTQPVSHDEMEGFFTTFVQAFTKAAALVPPQRRESFQTEANVFRQGQNLGNQKGVSDSQLLDRLTQLVEQNAATDNANTAYVFQRCGGRNAVLGSTASSSTG